MYVEIVSGGQPFTAGRVCLKKMTFAPWVQAEWAKPAFAFFPAAAGTHLPTPGMEGWVDTE